MLACNLNDNLIFLLIFQESQPRGDYREFLEISLIFIGGIPPRGITFKAPGAVHHARWLSKAIYCLKIFLFQKEFKLKKREIDGLREICKFIICFYVKIWFDAPRAIKAPSQDLTLIQELIKYRKFNARVSETALRKFSNHLWYLSEDLIALAFFDGSVSNEVKVKMVKNMQNREVTAITSRRAEINLKDCETLLTKNLSDFVTKRSLFLLEQFGLPYDFLTLNPENWNNNKSYNDFLQVFKDIKVVNDVAERGVALIEEFNNLLTKNEEQKQFLLQVVKYHRKQYPNCEKKTLSSMAV